MPGPSDWKALAFLPICFPQEWSPEIRDHASFLLARPTASSPKAEVSRLLWVIPTYGLLADEAVGPLCTAPGLSQRPVEVGLRGYADHGTAGLGEGATREPQELPGLVLPPLKVCTMECQRGCVRGSQV